MDRLRHGRKQIAALAVACLAAVGAPRVEAAGPYHLVLTGSSSGFVDVELGTGNRFDLERADYQGGTAYLGVVFARIVPDSEDSLLGIVFRQADVQSPPPAVELGHVQTGDGGSPLSPGTYRVYLLTDGPATVSIPATGLGRDVTLRVTRPASPRLRVIDVATPLAPGIDGLYQGTGRLGFAMDGHAMTIARLAVVFASGTFTKQGADLCDNEVGGTCHDVTGGSFQTQILSEGERYAITGYVPRDLWPPGSYEFVGSCYSLSPVPTCRLAALDEFVSRAAPSVVLRIPEHVAPAPTATTPSTRPVGPEGLASSGPPDFVPVLGSVVLVLTCWLVRRMRRTLPTG